MRVAIAFVVVLAACGSDVDRCSDWSYGSVNLFSYNIVATRTADGVTTAALGGELVRIASDGTVQMSKDIGTTDITTSAAIKVDASQRPVWSKYNAGDLVAFDENFNVRWTMPGQRDTFVFFDVDDAGNTAIAVRPIGSTDMTTYTYRNADGSIRWQITGEPTDSEIKIASSGDVFAFQETARTRYDKTNGAVVERISLQPIDYALALDDGSFFGVTRLPDPDVTYVSKFAADGTMQWITTHENARWDAIVLTATNDLLISDRGLLQIDGNTGDVRRSGTDCSFPKLLAADGTHYVSYTYTDTPDHEGRGAVVQVPLPF
jgi:hypothetical protein